MAAHKGQPKVGGRKKGSKNKVTASVKEALTQAFERMGGVESLIAWAQAEPTEFFRIWSKMLPQEVNNQISGADGGPVIVKINKVIRGSSSGSDDGTPSSPE